MQFWILSPSVHVLGTRELGFRHISTVWFLLCTSLASDSIRHDSCRLAFSETLLRTPQHSARPRYSPHKPRHVTAPLACGSPGYAHERSLERPTRAHAQRRARGSSFVWCAETRDGVSCVCLCQCLCVAVCLCLCVSVSSRQCLCQNQTIFFLHGDG